MALTERQLANQAAYRARQREAKITEQRFAGLREKASRLVQGNGDARTIVGAITLEEYRRLDAAGKIDRPMTGQSITRRHERLAVTR